MMQWSKAIIINKILKDYKSGKNLMAGWIAMNAPNFYQAACYYFGNWQNAFKATGLNYEKLVKKHREAKRNDLLNSIRMLWKMKLPLAPGYVARHDRRLYNRTRQLFGTWLNAVKAAGFNYVKVKKVMEGWERDKLIKQIRTLVRPGQKLTVKYLIANSFSLHNAKKLFGSLQEAVRAAGINCICSNIRWSKERVIAKLKQLIKDDQRLNTANVKRIDRLLYSAGERHFGSWRATLTALGLNYDKVAIRPFHGRAKPKRSNNS